MTFLEIEQLTLRIFAYHGRWKRARYAPSAYAGFLRTVAPALDLKLYDYQIKALDMFYVQQEILKRMPVIRRHYPASFVETPIGPIPRDMRDRIVLAMDPKKDDLRNRESWLCTIKRMDGR